MRFYLLTYTHVYDIYIYVCVYVCINANICIFILINRFIGGAIKKHTYYISYTYNIYIFSRLYILQAATSQQVNNTHIVPLQSSKINHYIKFTNYNVFSKYCIY